MNRMAAMVIVTGVIALAAISAIAANLGPDETVIATHAPGTGEAARVDAPFAKVHESGGETHVKAPFVDIKVPNDDDAD